MDMMFDTKYSKDTSKYISESGSPFLDEYEYKFEDTGHKQLVKKGSQIDVYERIQADADSCDINILMKRFALGDSEALNINQGFYLDTRNLPKTYAEVFARGLEAEQFFEGLPVELKEMFDNSHSVFFTEMGSKSFDEKVSKYNDQFVNHQFDIVGDIPKEEDTGVKEINYHE